MHETGLLDGLQWGVSAIQGRRPYMEDMHQVSACPRSPSLPPARRRCPRHTHNHTLTAEQRRRRPQCDSEGSRRAVGSVPASDDLKRTSVRLLFARESRDLPPASAAATAPGVRTSPHLTLPSLTLPGVRSLLDLRRCGVPSPDTRPRAEPTPAPHPTPFPAAAHAPPPFLYLVASSNRCLVQVLALPKPLARLTHFFAVYDGHGGKRAAAWARGHLLPKLQAYIVSAVERNGGARTASSSSVGVAA